MRRVILVLVGIAAGACASGPPPDVDVFDESLYDESFDEVWDAAVEVFANFNIPINNIEKDSGIIASDWMRSQDDSWQDCGSAGIGTNRDQQVRFNVLMRSASDGGTNVRINTLFQARRPMADNISVPCASTGVIEKLIHQRMADYIWEHGTD